MAKLCRDGRAPPHKGAAAVSCADLSLQYLLNLSGGLIWVLEDLGVIGIGRSGSVGRGVVRVILSKFRL